MKAFLAIALLAASLTQAPRADGIVWLFFVDDLHLDFRNTGRNRDLLRTAVKAVAHDGDAIGIYSSGPSALWLAPTADRAPIEAAIRKATGNGLHPADAVRARPIPGQRDEGEYRATIALSQAADMLGSLDAGNPQRTAIIYVSNGFDLAGDGLRDRLSAFTAKAAAAGIRIFAVGPGRFSIDLDRDPTIDPDALAAYWTARKASLRALAEPTGGVALVDYTDVPAAMRGIRAGMLR